MIRRLLLGSEQDRLTTRETAPLELASPRPRRPPPPSTSPPTPSQPRTPVSRPVAGTSQAPSARASLLRDLSTPAGVRRAVLLAEILGRPMALREPRDGPAGF